MTDQARTDFDKSPGIDTLTEPGYHKRLSGRHIQMIAFGGAIGSGLFLGAGGRLATAGPALILVYALAGLIAFLVVRAMGEMIMHRPSSGSFVSYAREFVGERTAFFGGWMYFLNWACSGIADVTAAAIYSKFFFPDVAQWIPALIALGVVLVINLVSVRVFGELEFWFAAIKVFSLVVFMVIAIVVLASRHPVDGVTTGPSLMVANGGLFPNGALPALMILQGVVFAYAGVEMIGVAAGETRSPRTVVPRAVNSVGWRIVVFYVGSIALLTMLVPWSDFRAGESPFVTALDRVGVPYSGDVMTIVVLTAALSSLNAGLYTTGRVLRSLALHGSAPVIFARISSSGVPYAGVAVTTLIYFLGVWLNLVIPDQAFEVVTSLSAFGIVGMWATIMLAHLGMRRAIRAGRINQQSFRMPLSPWSNYLVLAFLGVVLIMTWFDDPVGRWVTLCAPLICIALVAGWTISRSKRHHLRGKDVASPIAESTTR